jgi:glycosyltransferase involved in cell wall biosynthesis
MNDKYSVLQIISGLGVGGAERLVVELALEMRRNNQCVEIISINQDQRILAQYPEAQKITTVLGIGKSIPSLARGVIKLLQCVTRHDRIVIHAHMFHALMFSILAKLLKPSTKIVFTSHNFGGFSFVRRTLIRSTKVFRFADVVFSKKQHLELNCPNVEVIPNFAPQFGMTKMPERRRRFSGGKIVFAFIGRLVNEKNPLYIVDQFLKMESNHATLIIAGVGPLKEKLCEMLENQTGEKKVKYLGQVNHVQNLLNDIDVLVLASSWEGMPMVILEAGAYGIPIISTGVGAIPEVLSGGCGYICKLDDLGSTMLKVVRDTDAAYLVGERLRLRVKEIFSIHKSFHLHHNLYSKCVGGG